MNKIARILLIAEELNQDYMGSHTAPTKSSNDAPIYDVEDVYPDLYERGGSEYVVMPEDYEGLRIIQEARNKPNFKVKVYRAVPDLNKEIDEKESIINNAKQALIAIKEHRAIKKSREAQNLIYSLMDKFPIEKYDYDTQQDLMIEELEKQLKKLEEQRKVTLKIERGNWVTPSRNYAKMHGLAHLKGKYKIVSKTVRAKDLYTDGNSLSEWGYDPQ